MGRAILVLNAGSSSLKIGLFEAPSLTVDVRGTVSLGAGGGLALSGPGADALKAAPAPPGERGLDEVVSWLVDAIRHADVGIAAAGHRVVHGGKHFDRAVLIDDGVMERLERLSALA